MTDQLIHTNNFDHEIYRAGDDLYLVYRPRTLGVAGAAMWLTFAGFGIFIAILTMVIAGIGHEGANWWVTGGVCALIGVVTLKKGLDSLAADRALKQRPFREMPYVLVGGGEVKTHDGASCLIGAAKLETAVVERGEVDRHVLSLRIGERQITIFDSGDVHDLDPVIASLGKAGVRR